MADERPERSQSGPAESTSGEAPSLWGSQPGAAPDPAPNPTTDPTRDPMPDPTAAPQLSVPVQPEPPEAPVTYTPPPEPTPDPAAPPPAATPRPPPQGRRWSLPPRPPAFDPKSSQWRDPGTKPPAWVWPSIALGLVYPAIAGSARLDAEMVERLPEPQGERFKQLARLPNFWTLVVAVVAIGIAVVFGLFKVGITDVWTESMVFLWLALALGMFSPAAALLMLVFFIPLDAFTAFQQGTLEPFFPALAGRAVSWWLLWLLAVAIPLMARALPGATLASGQPKNELIRKVLAYGASALAAAVLLFLWIGAAPFLIRPVFIWSERLGVPTDPAVVPIQYSGPLVVGLGVLTVLLVTLLRDWLQVLDQEANELNAPQELGVEDEPLGGDQVQFFVRLITDAFAVVALGGLITGALDVAVLFATLVLAKPIADRLLKLVPPLVEILSRIPWVLRFVGGAALTYLVGLVMSSTLQGGDQPSEFFPIVISVAVGLFLLQILLEVDLVADELADERSERDAAPPPAAPPPEPAAAAGGATLAILGAAVLLSLAALLATPSSTRANNCSGRGDCPQTAEAEAGAAAGAAAVVAITAVVAAHKVSDHKGRREKVRRRKRRGGSTGGDAGVGGAAGGGLSIGSVVTKVRQRAMGNYWRR